MRIIVFGATGRTGLRLVDLALAGGHEVTAFVRNEHAALPAKVQRIVGDALDAAEVRLAIRGQEGVICAIGGRGQGLEGPRTLIADCLRAIVQGMEAEGVRRIAMVAAKGILPHPGGGLWGDAVMPEKLKWAFEDHRAAWTVLSASALDFVVVCPPHMPEGDATGAILVEAEAFPGGGPVVTGDVAEVIWRAFLDRARSRERLGVASVRPGGS